MDLVELFNADDGFRMIVQGSSNSGKTSFIRMISIMMRQYFDRIYVMSNNAKFNPNYDFADNRISGDSSHLDSVITKILDYQKSCFEGGIPMPRLLLIVEDFISIYLSPKPKIQARLATEGRNYNISIIWVSHQISIMPTIIRNNSTHIVTMGSISIDQIKCTMKYLGGDISESKVRKLIKNKKPFTALILY